MKMKVDLDLEDTIHILVKNIGLREVVRSLVRQERAIFDQDGMNKYEEDVDRICKILEQEEEN